MQKRARIVLAALAASWLVACGGGGGGGGSSAPPAPDPGSFTLSSTTAAFTSYQGRGLPAPSEIQLHIQNTSNVGAVAAAYVAPNQPASWLVATLTGSAADYTLGLSVDTTGLQPGTYHAVITVGTGTAAGAVLKTRTVAIDFTFRAISIVGPTVTFADQTVLGHDNVVRTFIAAVNAPAGVGWTASADQPWIHVPNTAFTGPATVTVTMDAAAIPPGSVQGMVTWTSQADSQDYTSTPVVLTVVLPTLNVTDPAPVLGGIDGTQSPVGTLNVQLGTGSRTHPFTVSVTTDDGQSWLQVDPTATQVGEAGLALGLHAERSAMVPGAYSGTVTISANVEGVSIEQTRTVQFNWETHSLIASSLGVGFSKFPGHSVLLRKVRVASSYGRNDIHWNASSDAAWLTVTPSGLTGGEAQLSANPAGLAAGQLHRATVTIDSPDDFVENQQVIRVALWIGAADPVNSWTAATAVQLAVSPVDPRAYLNEANGDISVYDVYSGALVTTFPAVTADYNSGMVLSDDGLTLFVADAINSRVIKLDPATGASLGSIDGVSGDFVNVVYARPDAHPVLILGSGEVIDVATGTPFTRQLAENAYREWQSIATMSTQRYLYTQDSGLSGSTLLRYRVGYSALIPDHWYAQVEGQTSGGANGQDLCVSADDQRVYTANGYPYYFNVFNAETLEMLAPLPATSYPQSTECAWNGLFAGSTFGGDSDPFNNWVYDEDGNEVQADLIRGPGHEVARNQVHFSADATRMIIVTGGPSLSLNFVDAPVH